MFQITAENNNANLQHNGNGDFPDNLSSHSGKLICFTAQFSSVIVYAFWFETNEWTVDFTSFGHSHFVISGFDFMPI